MTRLSFTVSGPDLGKGYVDPGPAVSRAITAACAAADACTYYVRDVGGNPVGRAERDELGRVSFWSAA